MTDCGKADEQAGARADFLARNTFIARLVSDGSLEIVVCSRAAIEGCCGEALQQ